VQDQSFIARLYSTQNINQYAVDCRVYSVFLTSVVISVIVFKETRVNLQRLCCL